MTASVTRSVTDALFTRLDTGLGDVPLGDGVAPASPGTPPLYAVMDMMDGLVRSDMDEADSLVKHVVQVRGVGATRDAAQYVLDLARDALLDRTDLGVSGTTLIHVAIEAGGRVARDNDADPNVLFVGMDRYAFTFDTRS